MLCRRRRRGWCSSTAFMRRSCRRWPACRPACQVSTLAAALKTGAARWSSSTSARHVAFENNVFAALNTASCSDGALVTCRAKMRRCAAPVHLLFVATQKEVASLSALPGGGRKPAAACTVIEDYVALTEDGLFDQCGDAKSCSAPTRACSHVRVQRESAERFSHRQLRGVAGARTAAIMSISGRRSARAFRATTSTSLQSGRGRRMRDRRARADRRPPARRHAYTDRPRQAATASAAQLHKMHRRRRRARGVQRQDRRARRARS